MKNCYCFEGVEQHDAVVRDDDDDFVGEQVVDRQGKEMIMWEPVPL